MAFNIRGAIKGGVLGGFLESDPEEERQRRYDELTTSLKERYGTMKKNALERIKKYGSGTRSNMKQSAGVRAAALGRPELAEGFIRPAEQDAITQQSNLLTQTESNYDEELSRTLFGVEQDFANRPIEPSILDTLIETAGMAVGFKQNQDYLDILGGKNNMLGKRKQLVSNNNTSYKDFLNTETPYDEYSWMKD